MRDITGKWLALVLGLVTFARAALRHPKLHEIRVG
jgi:hypothetical protein